MFRVAAQCRPSKLSQLASIPNLRSILSFSKSPAALTVQQYRNGDYGRNSKTINHSWYFILLALSLAAGYDQVGCSDNTTCLPSTQSNDVARDRVITELRSFLRNDQIELNIDELKSRGKPWNSYHKSANYPDVIVYPETTAEVSCILRVCNDYNFPVVAFGGGTSLEGHTLALERGLSLDFNRMKQVLSLNETDLDATVQPGLGYIELNEYLKDKKLWFPLDPGPGASIGGMCATRCSGSTAVRYGSMRDNVLSLTAVLADGTIIKTGQRARKSSAGYDLTRLLIGSEGTLGIITEITLKLHGIPAVSHAVRVSFPEQVNSNLTGIEAAALTAKNTLNCGVTIGRCELLDDTMVEIVNNAGTNQPLPKMTTLLYDIPGMSEQSVSESINVIRSIAIANGAADIVIATDPKQCHEMWKVRKECLWSAMSQYPDREAVVTDVCVPLSKLPELIQQTRSEIPPGVPSPIVAHAGDGNFHAILMINPADAAEVSKVKSFLSTMTKRAIAAGGTCTGEHGVGTGKMEYLELEMGSGSIETMKRIKETMDPKNILNPGKVIKLDESHTIKGHKKCLCH